MRAFFVWMSIGFLWISHSYGIEDNELKGMLLDEFRPFEEIPFSKFDWIRQKQSVSDKQFHRVLTNLWAETEGRVSMQEQESDEKERARVILSFIISLLPRCGDIPVKDFLRDAVMSVKDTFVRWDIIHEYLPLADADEAREILLRFLVGEERLSGGDRLGIYSYAEGAHDGTDSLEKRAAILGVLAVAADREEEKVIFMKVDGILAKRNGLYRRSRERLAMLARHALEPPTTNLYTDRDLAAALKEVRGYRDLARIDTNLASVAAGEAGWTRLENTVPKKWTPVPPETPKRRLSAWIAGAVAAIAATTLGCLLWRGVRRKRR